MAVGDLLEGFHPHAYKRRQIRLENRGAVSIGVSRDNLQRIGTTRPRCERDDRRAVIPVARLDLVDMSEARRWLEAGGKLELPAVRDGVVEKSLDVRRRA